MVKAMHLQENNFLTLAPSRSRGQGHTKSCPVPFTSCGLCTSLKLLHPKVKEKMHLQEKHYLTLTLGSRNVTGRQTDRQTDEQTTDQLWYEINIPFFLKIKHV